MESFKEVFDLVKEQCRGQMSSVAYDLWVKDIMPLRMEGSTAFLLVRSEFKQNIIIEKYKDLLSHAFEEVMGFPVDIIVDSEETTKVEARQASEKLANSSQEELERAAAGGDYEYTFNTFIVGQSNKFAHAASLAVASNPAGAYNPLFIYGGSGLGKTHLLRAICAEVLKNTPSSNILYVKGEDFTNELIDAIRNETTQEFHNKYRQADLLLVDDIQFIGGKESTQEEFFHTFNSLYEANKQIVLTSDRPPKEIKTLEDRLRTRFEWGLLADIQPPDIETRIAIIRRKAELLSLVIPDDVAEYIANKLKTNIRQLEGVVKKLNAHKMLNGLPPSILLAQTSIRDILNDHQPVPVTIDRIISEVARTFNGVSPQDIRSNKRAANISMARQVSVYIVREITQMSMSAIGEEFGGRDHSTIVYAIQQVEKNMEIDSRLRETIEDIIKNVRNS